MLLRQQYWHHFIKNTKNLTYSEGDPHEQLKAFFINGKKHALAYDVNGHLDRWWKRLEVNPGEQIGNTFVNFFNEYLGGWGVFPKAWESSGSEEEVGRRRWDGTEWSGWSKPWLKRRSSGGGGGGRSRKKGIGWWWKTGWGSGSGSGSGSKAFQIRLEQETDCHFS